MLEADLVEAVIEVWSEPREGRTPTLAEAVGAVIWYSEHDAYQRTNPDARDGWVRCGRTICLLRCGPGGF